MDSKNELREYLKDITSEIENLPEKTWLKPAAKCHLQMFAKRKGLTVDDQTLDQLINERFYKQGGTK